MKIKIKKLKIKTNGLWNIAIELENKFRFRTWKEYSGRKKMYFKTNSFYKEVRFPRIRLLSFSNNHNGSFEVKLFGKVISNEFSLSKWLCDKGFREPIYVVKFSRDCDMVEAYYFLKFYTKKAFEEYEINAYEWAEGPVNFSIVSQHEWEQAHLEYTGPRDRILEAYENGRSWSIYV